MIRDIVGTFLDTLSEREFDGPLLALLTSQGFEDVHFIHGAFEFGKDVIAKKRDPVTGDLHQYAIQSKAGDINQAGWREVRSQLEEAEYNTQAHPGYDAALPRVAVLVTTGRLKGAAAVDASEFKKAMQTRGIARLEVWERSQLIDWICNDPSIGLAGTEIQIELLAVLTKVLDGSITEQEIERHARRWLGLGGAVQACIEGAIIVNALRQTRRLDLAAMTALQLMRATQSDDQAPNPVRTSTRRLLVGVATELLRQAEPLLEDPLELARVTFSPTSIGTYPVVCCRLAEILALLSLASADSGDLPTETAASVALVKLAAHPGTTRPPSDSFGASIVAVAVMLSRYDKPAAEKYVHAVSRWVLDRYDPDLAGLGLASMYEPEADVFGRLVGGALEGTSIARRTSSYLAVVVLDLCLFLGLEELYEGVRQNLAALRVAPETARADESAAVWARGGSNVWPHPRVEFGDWSTESTTPGATPRDENSPVETMFLTSACRSRHYRGSWRGVARLPPPSA